MAAEASSNSTTLENDSHMSKAAATGASKDEARDVTSKASKKRRMSKKKLKKTILKYEKRMKLLHEQIKKFQEADISLDEMDDEDSVYVRSDYLMQRLVRTWEEWCHLTSNSPQIVVSTAEAKDYAGTEFEELNKKVQKVLEGDDFPDYQDIRELVEQCNTKHNLGLSREKEQELSRTVFKDVGKLMKKKRRQDFLNHFGCHLTDAVHLTDDPALADKELSSVLAGIDSKAQAQMEQIMEEFVSKQNTRQQCTSSSEGEEEEEEEEEVEGGQGTAKGLGPLEEVEGSTSGRESGESANEGNGDDPSDQEEEGADTITRNEEDGGLYVNGEIPSVEVAEMTASPLGSCPSSPEFIEHAGPRGSILEGVPTVGEPLKEDKCIVPDEALYGTTAERSPDPKRRKVGSADIIILDDDDDV